MKTRIMIASNIYKDLILLDLQASIMNPMINAQRSLLFADALIVCDATSNQSPLDDGSIAVEVQTQGCGHQEILIRAAKARFAGQLEGPPGSGRRCVN